MAILAECPLCHKKQATKNKRCRCGANLDKSKKAGKVRFWINYRLPDGTQRREAVGFSIEEARAAEGKRRAQKVENPGILEIKPEAKMTFAELTEWYLSLERVKALASFERIKIAIGNFNTELGNVLIKDIKPSQIENYQVIRMKKDLARATVDREVGEVKTMINKAYNDGMVSDRTVMLFKKIKKLLKKNSNARNTILSKDEFNRLISHSPSHLLAILTTGFLTGMRKGEILSLTWDKVDLQNGFIHLEAEDTKDQEPRSIPINDELRTVLSRLPRAIHHKQVFTYRGKPITDNFKRSLKKACEKAGIIYGRKVSGGFTFHDLRHSFNTHMRKAGVPESVIMQITGHNTREMFDRYNTVDADDAKEAMATLSDYFSSKKKENVDQNVDQSS